MAGNLTHVRDLTLAKDWIYVFCTVIQTVLAVIGLVFVSFWWDRRKAKDERKRAAQQRREEERQKEIQREEDRQRADAEKIAAILSDSYYEVEDIFHGLKESVDKLREGKILGGLNKFHVLLYMCRSDNWEEFVASRTDPRDEVLSDVEEIMKFFLKFRVNLHSIMQDKACSDDIKSEFSSKITEMGKIIYPFVEKHRQDVIEKVLKYFVSAATTQVPATSHAPEDPTVQGHPNPQDELPSTRRCCFLPGVSRCCGRQEKSGDETKRLTHDTSIEMQPTASTSIEPNANQGPELIHYPGNAAIESIPYLKCFSYEGKGNMKLNFYNIRTDISSFMHQVEYGRKPEKEDEVLEKIDELWQLNDQEPPGGGLLHSIRMIMFKLSEDCQFFNRHEGSLYKFQQYIRKITYVNMPEYKTVQECEHMLSVINMRIGNLSNKSKSLLVLPETYDMLMSVDRTLKEFLFRKKQLLDQAQQQYQLSQQQSQGKLLH